MPGPPPPPPAAPPPICPPPPTFSPSLESGTQPRGALLQSIRQGTKLKKAVTNDRSAPVVGNKSHANNNNNTNSTGNFSNSSSVSSVPNGLGFGGLFADGIPKLRPTGKLGSTTNDSNSTLNTSNSRPPGPSLPQKNVNVQNEVQSQLKKQMASDSNRNRGPPPPAPIRIISQSTENIQSSLKQAFLARNGGSPNGLNSNTSTIHKSYISGTQQAPMSPQPGTGTLQANTSTLHRKANSSANLTVFDSESSTNSGLSIPRPSNRKPHLAPKPPTLNGKPAAPPKKLLVNGRPSSITRAQSMRSPRSPSPQSPDDANYHTKFGTVRNISSVLDKSLNQNAGRTRPTLNGRPTAPPPSIPPQQTPPPPPSKVIVKPPNHAPPPPPPNAVIPQAPSHAPPPPPHRINVQSQLPTRAPPAVPPNLAAPPPPPRHSSMRDAANRRTLDLELRFRSDFHLVHNFPPPGFYRGLPKLYSSKSVGSKQQAPLPPNHIQLNSRLWDSSSC